MTNKQWHDLIEQKMSRRSWLKLSIAAVGAAVAPIPALTGSAAAAPASRTAPPFSAIKAQKTDDLVLPRGYSYNVVRAFGDRITDGENFGYNADYTQFMPINGLDVGFDAKNYNSAFYGKGASSSDGMLVVNHEYVNPMLIYGYTGGTKSQAQIDQERAAVGLSVFRVQKNKNGQWGFADDPMNRRINAWTMAQFTGPAAGSSAVKGSAMAMGSVGNCSGGATPWGTVLTCEENVDEYGTAVDKGGAGWDSAYTKEHQGWVMEVDPYNPSSMPRKHTALGRFRHENVAVVVSSNNKVVAYMGDDKNDSCVYKFVSAGTYDPANREANMRLLESGDLYVADFSTGKWRLLNYDKVEALRTALKADGKTPVFTSQADVLADARTAALAAKGTPVDRPEDIEIHPKTGQVYIALTNNTPHGNFHGQIVRLAEDNNNYEGQDFDWELFAAGGPQSGFSSPDNMIFDPNGNLWMVTDISSSRVGTGIYSFQGNNAMFFFATEGPNAGKAVQFASGPNECEMTGQCWTPDGRTMFLAIQHPGEESPSLDKLSSTWPRINGESYPRPAVVAVNGFKGF